MRHLEPLDVQGRRTPDPYGHAELVKRAIAAITYASEPPTMNAALHETSYDRARRRGLLEAISIITYESSKLTDELHQIISEGTATLV